MPCHASTLHFWEALPESAEVLMACRPTEAFVLMSPCGWREFVYIEQRFSVKQATQLVFLLGRVSCHARAHCHGRGDVARPFEVAIVDASVSAP